MTRSRISTLLIATCFAAGGACRGGSHETASATAGGCTVHEPGSPGERGVSAYTEHVTPTAGGGFGVGSLGVTITCVTDGPARDQVVLILPNLTRGQRPLVGHYRVRAPGDSALTKEEALDPRLAWARVSRGVDAPILYTARAGTVAVTRSEDGLLEGAYQLALSVADSAIALPGARPEVSGAVATDSTGRPPTGNTVLAGAFVAARTEADWRGR
ncbi:MAG TPA: hypothetical protein VF746_14640 [Longimicrobium sp.]|jgi:hypothetical protein